MLMLTLGFNVMNIRARHKLKEREEAVSASNDVNNPVQVLVTSVKVSSVAINLQKDCSDVIFVDVPSNAQSKLQCGGRVVRIGQRRGCTIYIITTDHSYDQTLQAIAAKKVISIIAAYTSRSVSDEEVKAYVKDNEINEDIVGIDELGLIRDVLINESCGEDYRQMFGQRSRREDWGSA